MRRNQQRSIHGRIQTAHSAFKQAVRVPGWITAGPHWRLNIPQICLSIFILLLVVWERHRNAEKPRRSQQSFNLKRSEELFQLRPVCQNFSTWLTHTSEFMFHTSYDVDLIRVNRANLTVITVFDSRGVLKSRKSCTLDRSVPNIFLGDEHWHQASRPLWLPVLARTEVPKTIWVVRGDWQLLEMCVPILF